MKKWKKYYRKNRKRIRFYIVIILILVVTIFIYNQVLFKSTFFQDIGSSISKLFLPTNVNYVNTTSLHEENLKKENSDLKELLSLKETMTSYEMVYTTVVSRNVDYWFYTLTVDKGKKDGVKVDMIVINEDGLVGRVVEVYNNSSVIKLITSNDSLNKIAVDIDSKDNTFKGIISGYDINDNNILVTSIRSESDIEVGDNVVTNGIGNLFPAGIKVGIVDSVTSDDLGVSKILKVKSNVDFENLRYLAILKRGNEF